MQILVSVPIFSDHPGGEAQADFGQAQFIEKGKETTLHYLNLSFPYSNGDIFNCLEGKISNVCSRV